MDLGVVTMARLIDADALIQNHGNDVTNWDNPYAVKVSSIEHAPTVDAVEVVRCRDCKHWDSETWFCDIHSAFGHYDLEWNMFSEEDFCSCGERRSNA